MNWKQKYYSLAVRQAGNFDYKFNSSIIASIYQKYKPYILDKADSRSKIVRSWAQFCCQTKLRTSIGLKMGEIASVFLLPCYILFFWLSSKKRRMSYPRPIDGVLIWYPPYDKIPESILRMDVIHINPSQIYRYITSNDLIFLISSIKYIIINCGCKYISQFTLKCLISLSYMRPILDIYNTKYICIGKELDFTSSLQTYYLNTKNVKLYNIMHGDKYYYCREAFFYFNRVYVWNDFYIKLFKRMYCEADKFIVERPEIFYLKLENIKNNALGFLFPDGSDDAPGWVEMVNRLANSERKLIIRYHPIYDTKVNEWKNQLSNGIRISSPHEQSVKEFLNSVDVLICYPSTVIIEAALNGKPVICLRNSTVNQIRDYHFIFSQPNVTVAEAESLDTELIKSVIDKCGSQITRH